MRILFGIIAVFLFLLGNVAQARQRMELVPGSRYTSARAVALGDAFLPLADDGPSALFYNPAAIARIRHVHFEPLNLQINANDKLLKMTNSNTWKLFSLNEAAHILGARPGIPISGEYSLLPSFSFRGFAVGLLYSSRIRSAVWDNKIHYRSQYQFIPTIGTGIRLASGVVRLGYSAQWVQRAYGDVTLPLNTPNLGYAQNLKEGTAFSHNLALALTLPVEYLPAFNIVARNVMGAHYNTSTIFRLSEKSTGTPDDEPMTVDASVSIQPKIGNGAYFNLSFVYRDLTARSGVSIFGRAATGAEFSFRDLFFLRGGVGSGYLNAGLGLRRKRGELSLSWYAEEFGDSFRDFKDRRFVLQYQLRAF